MGTNQQAISIMENSETIDDEKLVEVAKALGVTPDAIKNFSEENVFNIISNTFTDQSSNNNNYLCVINPIEKILELYERLLLAEKEKNDYLHKLLDKK